MNLSKTKLLTSIAPFNNLLGKTEKWLTINCRKIKLIPAIQPTIKEGFRWGSFMLFVVLVAFSPGLLFSQNKTNLIHGVVKDTTGNTLAGATITLKGTKKTVVSGSDGTFSIDAAQGSALQISMTGYAKQEITINSDYIMVALNAFVSNLNDVVVVGYGTKKRKDLTGSLAVISGDEMAKSPVAALSNSLGGAIPGLIVNQTSGEPGSDAATINIRGIGTLGDNSPLIVVDGIPDREGGLDRINPSDIESLTVLKDASAAIYGARAANGVILITTKRGRVGKPTLSFNSNQSITQPDRVPKMLNAYEFAEATNEYDTYTGQQLTYTSDQLQKFKQGTDLGYTSTDWCAVMKKWSFQTNNNISLRGGSENVKYFISGQLLRQNSMYNGNADYYSNKNGRANLDIQATPSFKIGIDVLYRQENKLTNSYGTGGIFNELWQAYPFLVPEYPGGKVGVGIGGGPGDAILYTLNGALGGDQETYDFLQTKSSFSWDLSKITKGLNLEGFYSYDLYNYNQKFFNATPPPAYAYSQAGDSLVQITSTVVPNLTINQQRTPNIVSNIKLSYSKRIDKHAIDVLVGYEQTKQASTALTGYRTGFIGNSVQELNAGSVIGETNNSSSSVYALQDYFGRISYSYDGKYLLDINGRMDGSSIFPPGKRFGFFPGVGLGWRVSKESFFQSSVITDLKVRGNYGTLGNDRVPAYQYLQTYTLQAGQNGMYLANGYFYGTNYAQYAGFSLGVTPNPNITWERSSDANVGVDMQLFHALSISVDAFRKLRSDILIPPTTTVPAYSGLSLPDVNFGKVLNHGIDLLIEYRKRASKTLSYFISANMTYAVNKVIQIGEPSSVPSYQKQTGYPSASYLLYQSEGLYQSQDQINKSPHPNGAQVGDIQYKDINGDDNISGLDQIRITESAVPQIMFGATFGGSYKNFDVTVFIGGQARAKALLMPSGLNMAEEFYRGRWQKEGDNKYPINFNGPANRQFGSNAWASTFWLRSDAYVKLKNVQIGYTLPRALLSTLKIQSVRIYVSGNNLFSIDSFGPSFDPEQGASSSTGHGYPIQRVLNFGANVTF